MNKTLFLLSVASLWILYSLESVKFGWVCYSNFLQTIITFSRVICFIYKVFFFFFICDQRNNSQLNRKHFSGPTPIYLLTFWAKHSEILHPTILSSISYLSFTPFIFKMYFLLWMCMLLSVQLMIFH